jgi:hypothetical protein
MGKKKGGEGVYSFLTQFWDLRYSLLIHLLESMVGPGWGVGGGGVGILLSLCLLQWEVKKNILQTSGAFSCEQHKLLNHPRCSVLHRYTISHHGKV